MLILRMPVKKKKTLTKTNACIMPNKYPLLGRNYGCNVHIAKYSSSPCQMSISQLLTCFYLHTTWKTIVIPVQVRAGKSGTRWTPSEPGLYAI